MDVLHFVLPLELELLMPTCCPVGDVPFWCWGLDLTVI